MGEASNNRHQIRLLGDLNTPGEDTAALEALLFVSDEPVELAVLAEALHCSRAEVADGLTRLGRLLEQDTRGIMLQWHGAAVQLVTAPRFSAAVSRFLSIERTVRLSNAALETLAIVVYRQPVTRAEIEAVRGVDSSGVLNTLAGRDLIEVSGRRTTPGNPLEYSTTEAFLRHFGLSSLAEFTEETDGE